MNNNAGARNQAPPPITQVPQRDDGSASSLEGLDLNDPAVQQDLDRLLADRSRQLQQQQAERFKKMGVDPRKPEQMQAMMKKMYIGMMKKNLTSDDAEEGYINAHMTEEEFEEHFTPWYK